MGVVERARSASRNIEEIRLAVSLLILKLGDEYLGLHYTILSSFVCSNFSHNKNFLYICASGFPFTRVFVCISLCVSASASLCVFVGSSLTQVWDLGVASVCRCPCVSELLWLCFLAPGSVEGVGVCACAERVCAAVGGRCCISLCAGDSPQQPCPPFCLGGALLQTGWVPFGSRSRGS